jgi:sugar lactone lactonase YvrE
MTEWQTAVRAGAECGERPYWDGSGLVWVDIPAGRLHRYRPGHGDEVVLELRRDGAPVPLGAAAPRRGGGYVMATAEGFRLTGRDGVLAEGALRPVGMAADAEFNDGACDKERRGRGYAAPARSSSASPPSASPPGPSRGRVACWTQAAMRSTRAAFEPDSA